VATAGNIIQDAFQRLGIYAAGETMTDADAERGLSVLNDMLDMWSNEQLFCYANLEQNLTLQPGVQQYTLGTGGSGLSVRPLDIRKGPGAAYITDQQGDIYYVEVVTQDVWNQIGYRLSNSNLPDTIFYDPQYPLGILNVFPIPSIGYTLSFDSFLQLSDFANLQTILTFPPGYKQAMQTCLAIMLGPEYKGEGWEPSSALQQQAIDAKRAIKITNTKPLTAIFDAAIVARAQSSYNIYRGR
jgi:hypothetical protein